MSEELEKRLFYEVEDRMKWLKRDVLPFNVDLYDERSLLEGGNPEEHYNPRFGIIFELIRKIRKLDGLTDNIVHPLIDEIIKVEDYSLETQVTMLTKLLEETSVRHSEGLPPPFKIPNIFAVKFQDRKGRMHLFNCDLDAQSLTQVTYAIKRQLGDEFDQNNPPQILYKDENVGNIVIASDSDLRGAVKFARLAGRKVLKLHLDYPKHVQAKVPVLDGASAVGLCMVLLASLSKFRSST